MEVFDLGIDNLEPININLGISENINYEPTTSSSGVNFGGGAEFLMNNSKRSGSSQNININLDELDSLETELNDLSKKSTSAAPPASGGETKFLSGLSNMFGFGGGGDSRTPDPGLGQATKETGAGNTKTWDGFSKFADIPEPADRPINNRISEREKLRKKKMMIKRLDEWREKGIVGSHVHFNNDTSYEEVEDEYESALEDKKKKESKKLYSWWFLTAVNTIEYANAALNPFDVNLDGWGEQVSDDIDSYDEIFGELYEKYKGGKLSPEIAIMLRLGFSAAVVSFTNKALSTSTPGFNDVIRQSPELMKMFTNATVNSMSQQSPGFAFANNLVNPESAAKSAPPPPQIDPRGVPGQRPGMQFTSNRPDAQFTSNRPDINAGRGVMFSEQGVDLKNNYDRMNVQERSTVKRPEMQGPRNPDINNILSGLKPKTVNIHASQEDDSMVSVSSLKDMNGISMPKSGGRRRKGSDKNIVSLDI
jgi:hypothetical protein